MWTFEQESEEEIVSILKQFEPVVQELKTVDEEQKKLLMEANEIKLRINAFEEKRSGIQVKIVPLGTIIHVESPS